MITRILLHYVLPLITPFVVYGLWLSWARRRAIAAEHDNVPHWGEAPITWLLIASAVLLAASVVAMGMIGNSPPEGVYYPPEVIDGKIVPSRVE